MVFEPTKTWVITDGYFSDDLALLEKKQPVYQGFVCFYQSQPGLHE